MSLKDCLFCDEKIIDEGLLGKTNNFYLKANLYPSSPGHVMIISRQHFSCFGEMPDDLDEEYLAFLDKTKKRIAKFFSEPIVTEQGIHGQSINHAHAHIFPSVSEIYDFSKRKMRDFVPEGIPVTRQNGLEDIKRILREDGQYVSIEEKGELYVCHTGNVDEIFRPSRDTIAQVSGLKYLLNWNTMNAEQKQTTQKWYAETIKKLRGKNAQ